MTIKLCHINLASGYRGGERQTELLIRSLQVLGYRQRLVARKDDELMRRLRDLEGLECVGLNKPFLPKLQVCRDADILHAHEAKAARLASAAHSLYDVPYVLTRRVDRPLRNFSLHGRMYANAASVVAVSQAVGHSLEQAPFVDSVRVIRDAHSSLAAEADRAAAIRKRFKGKFILGHAGALIDRNKGQKTLIEALRICAGQLPDLQLLLLGNGPDEAALKQATVGLDNVSFEGFSDDLGSYLAAMDLFVFPSRFEGLGSVLLDAMRSGLPVIASRVGGIPEIVQHQTNGLLVTPGDANELAAAIKQLHADAKLRQQLGKNAKQMAVDYSPARMARQYQDLYKAILHTQPGLPELA